MLKSLFNWKVLLNLLLAIGVFVGLIWLTFRWLEYHTNHGEEMPVPNVVNKSVYEAVQILEDAGLEYEVDSAKYDPKYKPLQVLKMSPSAGSRVKYERAIQLMVNPKFWAPVAIPDVVNKYSGLAFQRLDQVGLKIGDTIFEPSIQKDAVLRILYKGNPIKPGSLVPRFSVVDVVVGSGPMRNISIPNVVGLTVKEARSVIARSLFEVGLVDHEDGGRDESDIIYYQDPASGDMRDQGMQIDLWASKKTPAELSAKIEQLNATYRMKVDTGLPPIQYQEMLVHQEPTYEPVAPAPVPRKEVPKVNEPAVRTETSKTGTSRPAGTSENNRPKTTANTGGNSGNNTSAVKTASSSQQPSQKQKPKKVVVE
ncbi:MULTISPECIES: PASTA domain-containing protein [Chryseobacterium]|uniref:Beta-lactam-binding protein with PASTA domain n=1 Tax=Chryseobacterium camelliae TaxID=1265445 RepID=A0ABU0TF60_9FLAO|nr:MULTISPECIES: PASTA domain-containing protein [Chryseobacterium]MDQ1094895.1 beta-lactam-binding protein with PASTA domain [Chryseobacterium camelliae]MDR6086184.1 beta-lactam-binding protein with PASTA domain [Chryseobacterium sp. SORGH_AS_0909]MDR6130554.1 beta-lactam-binding protein with PASTA domain [Chryseobacterium sp. SORGH_AS_1175]MDT3407316.1 beta-lactam-binding protein with PASTA domain [Pseudacidovorax intermedius]